MHRDQKIGLSLAVLVIGFAGAFCFRNEPMPDPQPLSVEQAAELDARIEQLPIRAYTAREGVQLTDAEHPAVLPEDAIVDASALEQPADPVEIVSAEMGGDLIDLFSGPPEPVAADAITSEEKSVDSTTVPTQPGETTVILPPNIDRSLTSHSESLPSEQRPVTENSGSPRRDRRTYVVKSGDTLSGISLKFYKTERRYLDLYRANTDVLRSPNDLQVGQTLVIP